MQHLLFIVLLATSSIQARTLLKLNGSPISDTEVQSLFPDLKPEEAVERYLLYRLAIQKAEQEGLNQTDTFKKKQDKLLYNEFLASELSKNSNALAPTDKEVKAEYEKHPLYRVFHLVLKGEPATPENKKKIADIQKQVSHGEKFEKLVVKYSQDASGAFRGDLDYKGVHNIPKELYSLLQATEKNNVSSPLHLDGATHLVLWTDKKAYADVPVSYVEYLKTQLQKQKETVLLRTKLKDLLKTATIEKAEDIP